MKFHKTIFFITAIYAFLAPRGIYAAEISYGNCEHSFQDCAVISGKINIGDFDKFTTLLKEQYQRGVLVKSIVINSHGGNVVEAMKIGSLLRELMIGTYHGDCASACVLIWISGVTRERGGTYKKGTTNSMIGLHRPTITEASMFSNLAYKDAEKNYKQTISLVRRYMKEMEVSDEFIDMMLGTSSDDVLWVTSDYGGMNAPIIPDGGVPTDSPSYEEWSRAVNNEVCPKFTSAESREMTKLWMDSANSDGYFGSQPPEGRLKELRDKRAGISSCIRDKKPVAMARQRIFDENFSSAENR